MNIFENITCDKYFTWMSLIIAIISIAFAFLQWRKSINTRRAEFINQILDKLRFDKELRKIIYVFEYNYNWYDGSFHGSKLEKSVDMLLSYVNYICYLKITKNISKTEFEIFQYEIHRICMSSSSKCYLWNLYHFSIINNAPCSFLYLIDYGISEKLFPKEFKKNTSLYEKTLNW